MTASADSVHVLLQVVGTDQRGAGGEKAKTGFRWVDGVGTATEFRQDSPTVAPGGKKKRCGPWKIFQQQHTRSTSTNMIARIQHVALQHSLCINTVERLAGLPQFFRFFFWKSVVLIDLFFFFLFLHINRSYLQRIRQFMVNRSPRNHSGLLLYVALKKEEMLPSLQTLPTLIQTPRCSNEMVKLSQGDFFFLNIL